MLRVITLRRWRKLAVVTARVSNFFENKCCHPLISKTDILNTNDIIIDSSISGYNHNLSKLFDGNVNSEDPNAVVVCGAQEISDTNDLSFLSDGQKSVNVNATTSVLACVAENARMEKISSCGSDGKLVMLIDLKEVKSLCSVSMYFRPTHGPQALSVSVSIDKQLWFPTGGYRANNCNDTMKSRLNYDFARNIATRYIRLDFSNGCKPAIVLTEIQVFGTALNPVRWIRASQQHNNRSAVKQHPCDIQTQCVRRVWDENVHNIGKVVTIEISFNTSCNRLHSIAVGIANYSNHSSYIDEFFQSHVHSVVRETSFSLPRLYNILHYDLNASINMEKGIFELRMQYGTEIFRTAPLFVLLGGGFYNSTGMNSIKPLYFPLKYYPYSATAAAKWQL